MEHGLLEITGAWTKAGIASCVRVQGASKQDDFLFDCGFYSAETTYAKNVLISHGHIDHVGSCIAHARGKALLSGPATYYVPQDIVGHLNEARAAFEKLDDAPIAMNIVGVKPGDEFRMGSYKVKVFATIHRVPSQGYAIYSTKKGELLPELRGMSGSEIRELKMMGQAICGPEREELDMVSLCSILRASPSNFLLTEPSVQVYTGDTTMAAVTDLPANTPLFEAHTFIIECTYLDGDRAKAVEWSHVHLDDIIDNAHLFDKVHRLVLVHISQKYPLR
jgi:ribonuclease Z